MRVAFLIVTLIVSSLLGCAPTADLEVAAPQCKITLDGEATAAQMHNRQITFQHETGEKSYFDLTTNTFVCAPKYNERPVHAFEGNKAQTIYASASELHQNIRNVEFSQSAMTEISTAAFAENFCKNIGFNYIFGISDNGTEVIGCQPSELVQSAIMFKKTMQNTATITIASMGIYSPLIDEQLNQSG
jgi:hypothetical protein